MQTLGESWRVSTRRTYEAGAVPCPSELWEVVEHFGVPEEMAWLRPPLPMEGIGTVTLVSEERSFQVAHLVSGMGPVDRGQRANEDTHLHRRGPDCYSHTMTLGPTATARFCWPCARRRLSVVRIALLLCYYRCATVKET